MNKWIEFQSSQIPQSLSKEDSLCALDDTALLYVGGEDATDFLQNQLSNDIKHIDATQAQLSSFSNAKGRLLGIFRVIQIEGGYLLLMPKSILPEIQSNLQKFVIMSKVVMADISDSFARFSISTKQSELLNAEHFAAEVNQVFQSDSLITLKLQSHDDQQRYLFLSNDENEAIALWKQLAQSLIVNDQTSWRLQEILSGIPTIYPATMTAFVLQMCNLNLLDGVNFKKGCYPGQEVVARMQYLGKLKRRMYLAEINSDICPDPGAELKSRDAEKTDGSGKVVDSMGIDGNKCLMLFVAQIAKAEANELVLVDQPDANITLKNLPYSFAD